MGLPEVFSRLELWRCATVGASPRVRGRVWIHGGGRLRIGDRVVLDGRSAPIELHAGPGAEILLGNDVHIDGGASVEAQRSIWVGDGCRIGPFAKLLDNAFHPARGRRTRRPPSVPLVIGEGVQIGARAIVLPGARLGAHAKIGSGAVISRRIPPGASASGAPVRVLPPSEPGPR